MSNVINGKFGPQPGEQCFPSCECGETFVPLAIMGDRPFIGALVCPECENEVPVNNGFIGE